MVRQYGHLTVRGRIKSLPRANWFGLPPHPGVKGVEVPLLFQVQADEPLYWQCARLPRPLYAAYAVLQSHAVRALREVARKEKEKFPWANVNWQSAYPGALFFFELECVDVLASKDGLDTKRRVMSYSSFMHIFGHSVHDLEAWDGFS